MTTKYELSMRCQSVNVAQTFLHPIMTNVIPATDKQGQYIVVHFPEGRGFKMRDVEYSWDYGYEAAENHRRAFKKAIEHSDERNETSYMNNHYLQIPMPCGGYIFAPNGKNPLTLEKLPQCDYCRQTFDNCNCVHD